MGRGHDLESGHLGSQKLGEREQRSHHGGHGGIVRAGATVVVLSCPALSVRGGSASSTPVELGGNVFVESAPERSPTFMLRAPARPNARCRKRRRRGMVLSDRQAATRGSSRRSARR